MWWGIILLVRNLLDQEFDKNCEKEKKKDGNILLQSCCLLYTAQTKLSILALRFFSNLSQKPDFFGLTFGLMLSRWKRNDCLIWANDICCLAYPVLCMVGKVASRLRLSATVCLCLCLGVWECEGGGVVFVCVGVFKRHETFDLIWNRRSTQAHITELSNIATRFISYTYLPTLYIYKENHHHCNRLPHFPKISVTQSKLCSLEGR